MLWACSETFVVGRGGESTGPKKRIQIEDHPQGQSSALFASTDDAVKVSRIKWRCELPGNAEHFESGGRSDGLQQLCCDTRVCRCAHLCHLCKLSLIHPCLQGSKREEVCLLLAALRRHPLCRAFSCSSVVQWGQRSAFLRALPRSVRHEQVIRQC
jgi:hypothetical protein